MPRTLWSILRSRLRRSLSDDEFTAWFDPLQVRSEGSRQLVLEAPSDEFAKRLERRFRPLVDREMAGMKGSSYRVLFTCSRTAARGPSEGSSQATSRSPDPVRERSTPPSPKRLRRSTAKETTSTETDGRNPTPRGAGAAAPRPMLNAGYRFDSFVVGASNQFASAAAQAVAEAPGESYNPLFLYGAVGLGKTHLLHAIAHEAACRRPPETVLYLSAEQFVNELINSIRFDRMPAFRQRYRNIEVLLVDDVQFLAGKERTQEEFFHTFNALYTHRHQIILSSDSSPKDIPTLEERLRSRFGCGLIADIQAPDLETKIAILRRKASDAGHDLPDEVALFIAERVPSNIRELEGLLNRVLAFSSFTGNPLDVDFARDILREVLAAEARDPNPPEIIKAVARHYGLKLSEIKSRNNSRQIAFPRQVAMYLCKRLTKLSYPDIGKQFNNKHHSTVMYSVDKIEQLRRADPELDRVLARFASLLRTS